MILTISLESIYECIVIFSIIVVNSYKLTAKKLLMGVSFIPIAL
jgi:hypothetical protein